MKRENILKPPIGVNNIRVPVANSELNKQLIKIQGKLTSQIRQRSESDPYYYAFIKLKNQGADLPVIFRVKEENKLELKKGDYVELAGNYSNSDKNIRKSFTCFTYQLLDQKIKKECSGCGDNFICLKSDNYDYCKNCELNGKRHINKQNNCSECDGSGLIKFPQQPARRCKLCWLTVQTQFFTKPRNLANHE
ncbi:MAG: hypothetical protein GBAus27B_000172 [Mycoplasmataceae bacterium]|nr:MAG: hypothetical protein GBAus27B_000172 [Mycoplasmataceae bacterium]